MAREMNGRPISSGVPAVRPQKQRRKRGIVPKGSRAVLSPKERELHARLLAEGKPMSGRCGGYDYYVVNGKQRWRRHSIPKDPRTAAQRRSRTRFAAASKAWSEDGPLTQAYRDEWYADGAKSRSRPRLSSSGPLTGQQNFIGRNCIRTQRDSEMLLHPTQRQQKKMKSTAFRPELTAQVLQSQSVTRSTSGARRALTVPAPSPRAVPRGYLRKFRGRPLVSQVSPLQPVTRSTSDRPQTNTGLLPERYLWRAGAARGIGRLGDRNARRINARRGG